MTGYFGFCKNQKIVYVSTTPCYCQDFGPDTGSNKRAASVVINFGGLEIGKISGVISFFLFVLAFIGWLVCWFFFQEILNFLRIFKEKYCYIIFTKYIFFIVCLNLVSRDESCHSALDI